MTKAQKWAARAAAASGGNADAAAAAAAPEPAAAAAAAAAANGGKQTVDELKQALEDMRREMMLNSQSHQQEREDLIKKVAEAQEAAKKKDEEAKAAADAYKPEVLKQLENVENPLDTAKKGFGWLSAKACEMARVETPEDVKNRKIREEREAREKELLEKSQHSTPRDSALLRSGKAQMASVPGDAKFGENAAPKGKGFVPPGGYSIDAKAGEVYSVCICVCEYVSI